MIRMKSYVKKHGNVPTLYVDDKPCYSPAYMTYLTERGCYKSFNDADIHLYSVCIYFGGQTINARSEISIPFHKGIFDEREPDFTIPDRDIKRITDIDPDAKIFPRVNISPPLWWENENEQELNDKGAPGKEKRRVCFASDKWKKDTSEFIKKMCEHYSDNENIIGYQIACGNTEEWFPFDLDGGVGKRAREGYAKCTDAYKSENDFNLYLSDVIVDAISYFAGKIKEFTENSMVVGAFYGYTFETPARFSGHFSLHKLLRCKDIDFICSPISYAQVRNPECEHACMTVLDSVLLHGKLYFSEADERTHLSLYPYEYDDKLCRPGTYNEDIWKGPSDPFVARNVLRTCFARQLVHGNNFWWFDMWGGWFEDSGIMADMKVEAAIMKDSLNFQNRGINAEVAVIADEKGNACVENGNNVMYNFRIPLGKACVPYLAYDVSDFESIKDKYKAFIFVAAYTTKDLNTAVKEADKKGVPYMFLDNNSILSENVFREFFKANKIHIYSENKCILHVNENYLSVQSIEDTGKVKVVLPQKRKITPLFENEESIYTDILCLKMKKYETKLFKLE